MVNFLNIEIAKTSLRMELEERISKIIYHQPVAVRIRQFEVVAYASPVRLSFLPFASVVRSCSRINAFVAFPFDS